MSSKESNNTRQIELLTEKNFGSWFVNIRAELRTKKLWEYTQNAYTEEVSEEGKPLSEAATKKAEKTQRQWEEKAQEAADLMTPTISPGVQQKLTEADFNDGYLMLISLKVHCQPTGSSEFMRLSKEYYTLQFKAFKSVSEYLTHIKVLEERIDATKVTLNADNRTILCLMMSLPQEYQYLVQIWAVTPGITAEKARQMVLEASRQHNQALHNSDDPAVGLRHPSQAMKAQGKECEHCGQTNHVSEKCWNEFPELAPDWLKEKWKEQAKGTGKGAEKARKLQAKLARGDDFLDEGTHYTA